MAGSSWVIVARGGKSGRSKNPRKKANVVQDERSKQRDLFVLNRRRQLRVSEERERNDVALRCVASGG